MRSMLVLRSLVLRSLNVCGQRSQQGPTGLRIRGIARVGWAAGALAALALGCGGEDTGGFDPDPDVVVEVGEPMCSDDGFCWQAPLPQGNALRAVWASGPNEVWVAGAGGTMLRWDGELWSQISSGTTNTIRGLWGAGDDLWAVGHRGMTLRWDGATWQEVESGLSERRNLRGVWGSGPGDVWAVGDMLSSTAVRWDGTSFSDTDTRAFPLNGVWGSGPENVWAVGQSGTQHWDGGPAWESVPNPAFGSLIGIWGSAADDVWAVGAGSHGRGTITHWDGGEWEEVEAPQTRVLSAAWGSAADDVWAVGGGGAVLRWNGRAWYDVAPPKTATLRDVHGAVGGDVWMVGLAGTILQWRGDHWVRHAAGDARGLNGAWGSGPEDVWAVGDAGVIRRYDGSAWTEHESPVDENLSAVWAADEDNAWAVGERGTLLRWDGSRWERVEFGRSPTIETVWGTGPDNVWIGAVSSGQGAFRYWNGEELIHTGPGGTTARGYAFWGSAPDDVWAVGSAILHWDGEEWTQITTSREDLRAIWGRGADEIWAVGDRGTVRRFDGEEWSYEDEPVSYDLRAVWGDDEGNVWAAGADRRVLRWDGSAWHELDGAAAGFTALWGSGSSLWGVGAGGTIVHRDIAASD